MPPLPTFTGTKPMDEVAIVGEWADTDPHYGWQCTTLAVLANNWNEFVDEVNDFDAVLVPPGDTSGRVGIVKAQKGHRWMVMGWVGMTDHHVDARMYFGDSHFEVFEARALRTYHGDDTGTMEDFR